MSTKIAINGFGRIGRLALRAMLERHKQELAVVAVNDMADLQTNAHLFRYDSTYGIFPGQIETGEGVLKIEIGRSWSSIKKIPRGCRGEPSASISLSSPPASSTRRSRASPFGSGSKKSNGWVSKTIRRSFSKSKTQPSRAKRLDGSLWREPS